MSAIPEKYDPSKYPPFAVTADLVIFTVFNQELQVLLVKRADNPWKDCWALPGGFVHINEDIQTAATRKLKEETGVDTLLPGCYLEQLGTYGKVNRDPRMRVVSVAYWSFVQSEVFTVAGRDTIETAFWPITKAFDLHMAFDHQDILKDGIERARNKLEYTTLATKLCPESFSLTQLQHVYESVWGQKIHGNNFRRKILKTKNFVLPTGHLGPKGRQGPLPTMYKAGSSSLLHPPLLRSENKL